MNYDEIFNGTLDDLVFDGRNKAYGAYMLRKEYAKNSLAAFLVAVFLLLVLLAIAYWPQQVIEKPTSEEKTVATFLPPPPPISNKAQPKINIPKPPKLKNLVPIVTKKLVPDDKKMPSNEDAMKAPDIDNNNMTGLPDIGGDAFSGVPDEIVDNTQPTKKIVYDFVTEDPRFPGGKAAMYKYLISHTKYTNEARMLDIQGTVYVTFVVNSDGTISNVEIKRGVDKTLNAEAMKVISNMPKWTPGKINGKAVNVRCSLPIKFSLEP